MNFKTGTTLGPSLVSTWFYILLERIIECKVPFSTDEYILISDIILKTLVLPKFAKFSAKVFEIRDCSCPLGYCCFTVLKPAAVVPSVT